MNRTDTDLRREIAEVLGWRNLHNGWKRFPDQPILNSDALWGNSPDGAWTTVPDWPRSVDDALTLVPPDAAFNLVQFPPVVEGYAKALAWWASMSDDDFFDSLDDPERECATPAEAICRAWLAWHKAQDTQARNP